MSAELFQKLSPALQKAMLEGPAIRPPPGIKPNFQHPPNHREIGWVVCTLCSIISGIAMCLRIYSRIFVLRRFLIEDYIAVAALGSFVVFQYFVFSIVIYPGWFVHTWDIPLKNLSGFLYDLLSGAAVHGIVIMLLKMAIVLDLLRIFSPPGQRGWFFWICHLVMWINVVFYVTCTFLEIFGCHPREKLWNKLIPGKCIDTLKLHLASSAVNLPSDILIFILPQPLIWKLHISRRKKLGISAVFAFALFACISAAIRLKHSVPFLHDPDVLYISAPFGLWIEMEMTSGFLIIGMPTVPQIVKSSPVLQNVLTKATSWTNRSLSKSQTMTNSRKGLPKWYKPASRRRPVREPGWSALDMTEDGSVLQSLDNAGKVKTTDTVTSYRETVLQTPGNERIV